MGRVMVADAREAQVVPVWMRRRRVPAGHVFPSYRAPACQWLRPSPRRPAYNTRARPPGPCTLVREHDARAEDFRGLEALRPRRGSGLAGTAPAGTAGENRRCTPLRPLTSDGLRTHQKRINPPADVTSRAFSPSAPSDPAPEGHTPGVNHVSCPVARERADAFSPAARRSRPVPYRGSRAKQLSLQCVQSPRPHLAIRHRPSFPGARHDDTRPAPLNPDESGTNCSHDKHQSHMEMAPKPAAAPTALRLLQFLPDSFCTWQLAWGMLGPLRRDHVTRNHPLVLALA